MQLGLLGVAILAVLGWVGLLRRQVRRQTEVILERYEREQALEERYRELFENANDVVYTADLEGRFTSVNKAVERITGYTREETLRKPIE